MIEVYEGRLGGGKTYHAVKYMCKYFASGGVVCSNIMLNLEAVKEYLRLRFHWEYQKGQFIYLEDDQINQFYKHTPAGTPDTPSLVVIDEAHIWLNARDWANVLREMLVFLSQSRKCFTDIIFISQSALNLDKQIMRLVQYIWRFRDLKKLKISELGIGWPLNQFLVAQYDYDGKTLLDKRFELKDRGIYPLYNTYTLLRTFPRLEGHKIGDGGKIKGGKNKYIMKIIIGLIVIVGLLWLSWSRIGAVVGLKKDKPVPVQAVNVSGHEKPPLADMYKPSVKVAGFDVVMNEPFLGIVEDQKGRTVITSNDRYVQGQFCRVGKVLFCYDDKILIAGFDKKPHMVLSDLKAMAEINRQVRVQPENDNLNKKRLEASLDQGSSVLLGVEK